VTKRARWGGKKINNKTGEKCKEEEEENNKTEEETQE